MVGVRRPKRRPIDAEMVAPRYCDEMGSGYRVCEIVGIGMGGELERSGRRWRWKLNKGEGSTSR